MAFWEPCFGKDNECRDCDCGWTKLLLWAVAVLVAVLVIAFAVVYPPKATADDALLQRFALAPGSPASNSTISYNVTATVSLRNPNIYRTIAYGPLAVSFSFNGSRFDESATVPAFDARPRKTATVRVAVGGVAKPVKLTAPGVGEFAAENDTGKFVVSSRRRRHRVPEDQVHHPPGKEVWVLAPLLTSATSYRARFLLPFLLPVL